MIRTLISSLYDPKITLSKDIEFFKKALKDIEYFSISPQIYCLLEKRDVLSETPLFFQKTLKSKFQKNLYQNIMIKKKMEKILFKFDELEIPVIPLKGVYFAEKYFGHLGGRSTSDIDLLIKPVYLQEAIKCLHSLGFNVEEDPIPSHFHISFSMPLPHSPIPLTVELHWHILKENTSQLNIEEFWNEAKPIASFKSVMELSEHHTFYMICLHGWRHHMNSLKYFLDVLQVADAIGQPLNFDRIWKDAAVHKTLNRLHKTLQIVNQEFPQIVLLQGFQIKMKKNRWWEYRAIRDNQYKTYKQYISIFCFEFLDYDTFYDCFKALLHWFVPSREEVLYEVSPGRKKYSVICDYFRLYQTRSSSFANFLKKFLF